MYIMVLAAFWGDRERSDLLILERDFDSKKHGYYANSYLAILKKLVLPNWNNDLIFMQDNAPIYIAKKAKKWVEESGINVTDWPPYLPDLIPIKHA